MTFKAGFFFKIGLLIYVGVWAYFKFRPYMLLRKNAHPSVYEIERLDTISRVVRRSGWLGVFLLAIPFLWLFPEVVIVTQDAGRARAEHYGRYYGDMTPRETFFVDRYYVPFCYKGKFCVPGGKYLSNETDSVLVLYPTYFYNGLFTKATKEFRTINSHSFVQWYVYVDNKFDEPHEHWSEKHEEKDAIEWTLDTESGAIIGQNKVRNEIKKRNELIHRFMEQIEKKK